MSPIPILKELIAIPSINPLGHAVDAELRGEARMSAWLVDFFTALGARHERIEVAPGRDNVLARFDAPNSHRTILLDAHQDTVPVDGMTIPPFLPNCSHGRIYGRGAADVKGGMAAMLFAFQRLFQERPHSAANVVLSCTCDEEALALGVRDLVTYWRPGTTKSQLLARPPDVAIVAEPTELQVVVAHRGVLRFRVRTLGKACHSSAPEQGRNAIYSMAHVVSQLELEAANMARQGPRHALCGAPTLSVGRIEGGSAVNIVPDHCMIEVDRRLIPGEDALLVFDQLRSRLAGGVPESVVFEPPWLTAPALSDELNSRLAHELIRAVGELAMSSSIGVPYCTNASALGAAGIPTVVFGPGAIAQAHTCDEYIDVSQLEAASEIYYRFCTSPQEDRP